jgi:hypothetical protein
MKVLADGTQRGSIASNGNKVVPRSLQPVSGKIGLKNPGLKWTA